MRTLTLALIGLIAACSTAGTEVIGTDHPLAGRIWDVSAGEPLSRDALAEHLDAGEFVVLGEVHDNPRHHERQAWLTGRIAPAGLAFEMIPRASEEGLRVFLEQGGARTRIGEAIGWSRLGWPDWEMYAPILSAAPDAYIAGGGVRRADLRRAMREGPAAAFGEGSVGFGLHKALDPAERTAREDAMIASHCDRLPRAAAGGMVDAQRLRDARFAEAVRRAARKGGGQAVLITGNGHARTDHGVPTMLAEGGSERVRALGQIEVREGDTEPGDYAMPYDYVWFSARTMREDPCAAFE